MTATRAQILNLMAFRGEKRLDMFFEIESGMIAGD